MVCNFSTVFLNDLSSLPPKREKDYSIDWVSNTSPISLLPYKIAPTELKKLTIQLQELVDKGFVKTSVSP